MTVQHDTNHPNSPNTPPEYVPIEERMVGRPSVYKTPVQKPSLKIVH